MDGRMDVEQANQKQRAGGEAWGGWPWRRTPRERSRSADCLLQIQTLKSDTRAPAEWGDRGGSNRIGGSGSTKDPSNAPPHLHLHLHSSTTALCPSTRTHLSQGVPGLFLVRLRTGHPRFAVQARYFFSCVRAVHHWPTCGGARWEPYVPLRTMYCTIFPSVPPSLLLPWNLNPLSLFTGSTGSRVNPQE